MSFENAPIKAEGEIIGYQTAAPSPEEEIAYLRERLRVLRTVDRKYQFLRRYAREQKLMMEVDGAFVLVTDLDAFELWPTPLGSNDVNPLRAAP